MPAKKKTTDALEIIRSRFIENDPEMQTLVDEERADFQIGQLIYDLRRQRELSQAELAALVGTSQSVISRLERADYEGHSYSMLRRIGEALGRRALVLFPRDEAEAKLLHEIQAVAEELRDTRGWTPETIAKVLSDKLTPN